MSGSAVEAPNDQQQQPMLGKFDVAFGWLEGTCRRHGLTTISEVAGGEGSLKLARPSESADLTGYLALGVLRAAMGAAARLEALWDEVGQPLGERINFVESMVRGVGGLCESQVTSEVSIRDGLDAKIRATESELVAMCARIGCPLPSDTKDLEELIYGCPAVSLPTLTDKLALLELKADDIRKEEDRRRKKLRELQAAMRTACSNMAMDIEGDWLSEDTEHANLSDEHLKFVEEKAAEIELQRQDRARVIVLLVQECHRLFRELRWEPQLPLDHQIVRSLDPFCEEPRLRSDESNPSCVGLSRYSLDRLTSKIEELKEELTYRRNLADSQLEELRRLWGRLEVSAAEQKNFQDSLERGGCSFGDMERLEKELALRRRQQEGMLGYLIPETQRKAADLLMALDVSVEEAVPEYASALYVEDEHSWSASVLDGCIEAIKVLESRQERQAPLLKLIEQREAIVSDRDGFKAEVDYSARGAGLTQQLKRQELMKRRIKVTLPKLTESIREQLAEWEKVEGAPLRIGGRPYIETIEETDAAWEQRQEVAKAAKRSARGSILSSRSDARPSLHLRSESTMSIGSIGSPGNSASFSTPSSRKQRPSSSTAASASATSPSSVTTTSSSRRDSSRRDSKPRVVQDEMETPQQSRNPLLPS